MGIYLTNEVRLYEVTDTNRVSVRINNVVTEAAFWLPRASLKAYRIVLPEFPDTWDEGR